VKRGDMIKNESALLRNVQLFSSLTDQELLQISEKIRIKTFRKNETILHEEDTNEYMYTILSGKVKVIQTSEDGKETILAMHKTGDFFGEMSLIDGKTMPATVLAMEETLTAIISKQEFILLISMQGKVLEKLLIILCTRLRESWNKIQMLNFNNAAQRIKMLFSMLSAEYGEKSVDAITLNIKLTHQDIANMAGVTRETVTRVIDKWQRDKEITVLKSKIIRFHPDFFKKDLQLSTRR
jgi:CRP/FNR family transcriptional regulator, cyclic AMP receptor protein